MNRKAYHVLALLYLFYLILSICRC